MSDFKHLPWVFRNSNRDEDVMLEFEKSLSSVSDTSKINSSVLRLITILDPLEIDKILVSSLRDLFCELNFEGKSKKRYQEKKEKKKNTRKLKNI